MPDVDPSSALPETFSHAFTYTKRSEQTVASEEAETDIGEESVRIRYGKSSLQIAYRDILEATAENYRVRVILRDGALIEFYYLGHSFDSFTESFFQKYNTLIKSDSFMGEEAVCVKRGACFARTGSINDKGECDIYLGKHALIIQKVYGDPARLPYALIDAVEYRAYDFSIAIYGDRWDFSMLGHEYEGFQAQYDRCIGVLQAETTSLLQSIKPDLKKQDAERAADLYFDGRTVCEAASDTIVPGLWQAVFDKACEFGGAEYFSCLRNNAAEMILGIKESLFYADGNIIWMYAKVGNNVVFESASSAEAGMATYVFQIKDRFDTTVKLINCCMHMTEFRREPVYLSLEELNKPENTGYRNALGRVPQLNVLRGLYKGRLIHTSPESWVKNLGKITE